MKHFTQWCEAEWPGLLDWLETGDRGMSACSMVEVIVGIPDGYVQPFVPADEDDYRRCLALLRAVPAMVPHLGQVIRRDIRWRKWVERLRKELSA